MSISPLPHLVERAVEQMARQGAAPVPPAPPPPPGTIPFVPPATRAPAETAAFTPPSEPDVTMATLDAAGLVVAGALRSRVSEEWAVSAGNVIRTQQTLPRDLLGHASANLLLITSARAREGKSFSALNLAARLALGRMTEVLLLDADGKRGGLSHMLGLSECKGLFDIVADPTLRPEDLVRTTAIPGLNIFPNGHVDGTKGAQRAITTPVVTAITNVAHRFPNQLVILDCAPCLITSDASLLANSVGQTVMIVEAGRTQRSDLEAALELLRPCAAITLILNKMRLISEHAFGKHAYFDG